MSKNEKLIVQLGRDIPDEPKKLAKVDLKVDNDQIDVKLNSPVDVNLKVSPSSVFKIVKDFKDIMSRFKK